VNFYENSTKSQPLCSYWWVMLARQLINFFARLILNENVVRQDRIKWTINKDKHHTCHLFPNGPLSHLGGNNPFPIDHIHHIGQHSLFLQVILSSNHPHPYPSIGMIPYSRRKRIIDPCSQRWQLLNLWLFSHKQQSHFNLPSILKGRIERYNIRQQLIL